MRTFRASGNECICRDKDIDLSADCERECDPVHNLQGRTGAPGGFLAEWTKKSSPGAELEISELRRHGEARCFWSFNGEA